MSPLPGLTEDQRDCLQEVCNVALGQAADHLARTFGVFVTLPIPNISTLSVDQLADVVQAFKADDQLTGAKQSFSSRDPLPAMQGTVLILFSESSQSDLQAMLTSSAAKPELVAEAAQHIAEACLNALYEHWGWSLQTAALENLGAGSLSSMCESVVADAYSLLAVEINFRIENRPSFNSDLLLLFPDQSIANLIERLELLLA